MRRYGGATQVGRIGDAAARAAQSARSVEEFFEAVKRVVRPVLRFDICACVTVDPQTLMNTGGDYRDGLPPAMMPRMLDIEYREGDANDLSELAARPTPVGLLSRETNGNLDLSPRYRDIMRPLGFRDELRVLLRDRHGAWGALIMGRADDAPPFGSPELAVAASLVQPLGDALRRLHLTRLAEENTSGVAPGLVLLDGDHQVVHVTPTVAMWCDDLAHTDGVPPGDRGLPPAVYAVAAAVQAAGAAASHTSWMHSRRHGRVRLHAWRLEEPTATSARTAVVVELAGPAEHIALIVAAYGLTPRERDITALVLRGLSTADISHRAGLSPHTVQDHLKAVFDKTGVRSRRDLVATLFARHSLPDITPAASASQRPPRN
ncbi:helix-turn-helix transcriptional regulator [Streptomyces sp. AC558_RSS880]|uniref:helix-turn-helix domain-containing protein n=1 Tax=Streptomyces sp. AC558_RSS880 TaxID=2823687 RepID=UPI001C2267AB|nr:helix-turn-helix transcriptional regulator [Streptomyces sp. AC558_RSS880]